MKTISFELAKRLAPYIENIDTEYKIDENWNIYNDIQNELCDAFDNIHRYRKLYKTLTLEEAIDFILNKNLSIEFFNRDWERWCWENNWDWTYIKWPFIWKTPLDAVEKKLEYLLDNNLLTK